MKHNNNVIREIEKNKIIVIIRGVAKEKLIPLCEALYAGGIRLIELTYSADQRVSDEETAQNIKMLSQHFKDRLYVGAGTVITKKQVSLTQKAGGLFVISPNVDKVVIRKSKRAGLVSIPGALTPSEACAAKKYGADFIKLFPVTNLGPGYVNAIKAPLTHIKFLAVGGINLQNIPEYLQCGICGFGIGANITNKNMIERSDWTAIAELAASYTEAVKNA